MTLNQLIATVAVVIPCATAFLVGYWHRKQLRQIELARRDPSVSVLPPPSPPVAFFKRYRGLIVGVGMPVLSLASLMAMNYPAINGFAALIGLNVACILINLQSYSELQLLKLMLKHFTVTEHVSRTLDTQRRQTEAMETRLAELEKLAKDGSS
jgi:hypothetical protein